MSRVDIKRLKYFWSTSVQSAKSEDVRRHGCVWDVQLCSRRAAGKNRCNYIAADILTNQAKVHVPFLPLPVRSPYQGM